MSSYSCLLFPTHFLLSCPNPSSSNLSNFYFHHTLLHFLLILNIWPGGRKFSWSTCFILFFPTCLPKHRAPSTSFLQQSTVKHFRLRTEKTRVGPRCPLVTGTREMHYHFQLGGTGTHRGSNLCTQNSDTEIPLSPHQKGCH